MPYKIGGGNKLQYYDVKNGEYSKEYLAVLKKTNTHVGILDLYEIERHGENENDIFFPSYYGHEESYTKLFVKVFEEEISRINNISEKIQFYAINENGLYVNIGDSIYELNVNLILRKLLENPTLLDGTTLESDLMIIYPYSDFLYSPLLISSDFEKKVVYKSSGYFQITYTWLVGDYKYVSRWHTATPNSPLEEESWVINKHFRGIGSGLEARHGYTEYYLDKDEWISEETWKWACKLRRENRETKESRTILDRGHIRRKRK